MRLTAKSEYGLLAMIEIASAGGNPVSARSISETQKIPMKFLEQLLVALRRAGLVSARRGAHGGFILAVDGSQATVLDVVEALEGPLVAKLCDSGRGAVCGRTGACAASVVWNRATDSLRDVFSSTTLTDLVTEQNQFDLVHRNGSDGGRVERAR